jgi:hypothetical protein
MLMDLFLSAIAGREWVEWSTRTHPVARSISSRSSNTTHGNRKTHDSDFATKVLLDVAVLDCVRGIIRDDLVEACTVEFSNHIGGSRDRQVHCTFNTHG